MTALNSSGESIKSKCDPIQVFDQIVAKNKLKNEHDLKQRNIKADEITFEILADTVAQDIALMLKNTIDRSKKN